ncbi:hypothetical protein ABBQ38_014741 [Trebouxia sp. C0009 RCD-2024]
MGKDCPWEHTDIGADWKLPDRCIGATRTVVNALSAEPDQPSADHKTSGGLWRTVIKWILRLVGAALFSAAALLALLPSIVSSHRGCSACTAVASKFVPGTVQVAEIQARWQQPLDVRGVTWTEPTTLGGRQLASVEQIKTSIALIDVVRGKPFDVLISKPAVDCSIDAASGEVHITQVLQGTAQATQSTVETGDTVLAAATSRSHAKKQLLVESSPLRFTAEGQLLSAHVYISDGVLQVPDELRQVVGDDFHVSAIVGAQNMETYSEDFGIDAGWVQSQDGSHSKRGDATAVVFNSPHVTAQLRGWRTGSGLLLSEPATASVDYTPALAKYGLQRISPLLSNVVAVQEGGKVQMSFSPEGMALPAEKTSVHIEPMKLVVGQGDFVSKIVNLLGLKDSSLSKSSLQAWTSTIAVDVYPEGPVHTQRLDILVGTGHGQKGVHLCMWGSVEPANDSALNMTLGFPADTLKWAGLQGVPEDGMLTVAVTGTAYKPKIDWQGAYNKLTSSALKWQSHAPKASEAVSLKQAIANQALKGLGTLHHKVTSGDQAASPAVIPPPVAPLPWAVQQ